MSPLAEAAVAALQAGGSLADEIPAFRERAPQRDMAEAVADAIDDDATLLLEAGTGTGKTMAYLVPALLSGRRTVISTGTRHLQDQLYKRDLPLALKALGLPRKTALLKGRANYLCRHRLKQAAEQASGPEAGQILELRQFLESSRSGELADYGRLPDDSPLRPRITSTADNCLGKSCADFDDCFVVAARRRALDAEVVVVNHHLLFADFTLRQAGFGEMLPGAGVVIVDEAHQLPDLAASAFGERLSTRQLQDWLRDLRQWPRHGELADAAGLQRRFGAAVAALEAVLVELRSRTAWADFRQLFGAADALEGLDEVLQALMAAFARLAPDDEDGRRLAERLAEHAQLLQRFLHGAPEAGGDSHARAGAEASAEAPGGERAGREGDHSAEAREAPPEMVRWAEAAGRGGALCACPADISEAYTRATAGHEGAWVYVSATLSDGHDFRMFRQQLGLAPAAREQRLDSVFDYARQTRLWLPEPLPGPGDAAHTDALMAQVLPVIEAAGGGAFLLMTSHRAVARARQRLEEDGRFRLFVQGEDDRARLLHGFARGARSVLVGAASFWEGVDVPGDALRIVVIDKLPFAPPNDPVVQARSDAIRAAGGQPFMDYQLPQAIVSLRQGIGRLIRTENDRGLLVLGDPRISSKAYGQRVLQALPEMPRLASRAAAVEYARGLAPDGSGEAAA